MVSFGEKAKMKKAENLNEGRSYVITTVHQKDFCLLFLFCRRKSRESPLSWNSSQLSTWPGPKINSLKYANKIALYISSTDRKGELHVMLDMIYKC